MHADFELDSNGEVRPRGFGQGKGGGRPVGYQPKVGNKLMDGEGDGTESEPTSLAVRKARAQTSDLEWKALQSELNYKKDSGEYLSRSAFKEASATLLAEVAQALRSLPDILERKCNLEPDALIKAEQVIDDALSTLSAGLELFTEQDV